jgi:hypothetical protein
MAEIKIANISRYYKNNAVQPTTSTAKVVQQVKDNQLVNDDKDTNPGIVIDYRP